MKNIHVTDDLQQNLSDLERESLITRGVGDLIRMLHSVTETGDALESKITDAVYKSEEVTA